MYPVLLELGGLKIQSYGFFIALGYLAALMLSRRQARREGFEPAVFSGLCLIALLSGLIGARALFVLTNLAHFRENPAEIWRFWSGGVVFYGGFLLAAPLCALYLRHRKIPLAAGLDVLAPALALGHALGRIGCFAAGCCHGSICPYPWGVRFHTDLVDPALRGQPLHATQLYESLGLLALCSLLLWWSKKRPPAGALASAYVAGYGALRISVEIFRGDTIRGTVPGTPLSTSQAIATVLFFGGIVFLIRSFRRNH